jgi:hypothetical protein
VALQRIDNVGIVVESRSQFECVNRDIGYIATCCAAKEAGCE